MKTLKEKIKSLKLDWRENLTLKEKIKSLRIGK
jgi:hypothetical protein